LLVDAYLRGVVGEAGHFVGLLNRNCPFSLAGLAVGIQLEYRCTSWLSALAAPESIECSALSVYLVLDDDVVDYRAEVKHVSDALSEENDLLVDLFLLSCHFLDLNAFIFELQLQLRL